MNKCFYSFFRKGLLLLKCFNLDITFSTTRVMCNLTKARKSFHEKIVHCFGLYTEILITENKINLAPLGH